MCEHAFRDKTILITGGGTGIGKGCAEYFLRRGAWVTIAGPDEDVLRRAADELTASTGASAIRHARCDVTEEADVARATEVAAIDGRLDILLANAGTSMPGPIQLMDKAQWHFGYDVNVVGVALGIKHASRFMKPARAGSIIAISSVEAIRASLFMPSYNVTKGAQDILVACAARELGPFGIRVNGIRPGMIVTDAVRSSLDQKVVENGSRKTLLGRVGEPEDIAKAVAFFASPQADWVTGQVLNVCGGLSVHRGDSFESLARMVFGDDAIDRVKNS